MAKKELIISQEQIQEKVRDLALMISRDLKDSEPVFIGILNGVFMFFADLVRNMTIPIKIDFMRLASYGTKSYSTGQIRLVKDVELDITNRDVVIVEDIVDTGHTLKFLGGYLKDRMCRSVRICALIDKCERREQDVHLDYVGFHVEQGFLVGYGLDYDEQYRYLPAIYHLML